MIRFFTVSLLISLLAVAEAFAQQIPGAPPGVTIVKSFDTQQGGFKIPVKTPSQQSTNGFVYTTTTYTFADLVLFSYFNGSNFVLFDDTGTAIDSVNLNNNEFHIFSPGTGVYQIEGNNSFTLLIGDPITNSVMGFFAVDEAGRPLSTRLNTYMPKFEWGGELFILFAYSDNTQFQIKNLTTGVTLASGILNAGEHFESGGFLNTFVGVTSNKPVSALSYADQGYFIPAENGTFFGNSFYGYSGYIGGWLNGIVVTAYSENTDYTVVNTTTGDTISSGVLNEGEATTDFVSTGTYWDVMTSKDVTVCNTPFAAWSSSYFYLTRQMDESGRGIGTNFYSPVIIGDLDIFSYEDNNNITVFDTWTSTTLWSGTLNEGEGQNLSSSRTVYHITGTENLAVISSWGASFGADFMPLNFATSMPDLAISSNDIQFDPDTTMPTPGDPVTIYGTVHNFGFETAYNVGTQFFDGDPSGGLNIGPIMYTDSIPAGASHTFMQNWIIPDFPEFHSVYVYADPENLVIESNNSNNIAYRSLVPNDDLLPPLPTTIDAPVNVTVTNGILSFTQFDVTVNVFNTSQVTATNAYVVLHLPPDLSLSVSGDSLQNLGNIDPDQTVSHTWTININNIPNGDAFFYSIDVDASNAPSKTINRMLLINRVTGVEISDAGIPNTFKLKRNYPNPFNPSTTIRFELPVSSQIDLRVYNLLGQEVAVLINNEELSSGVYKYNFNASQLTSGVYFYRIITEDFIETKKMVLLR